MLLGLHGQHVFIVPEMETVIVKLSDDTNSDNEGAVAEMLYYIAKRF
jgi:hypothetical protein